MQNNQDTLFLAKEKQKIENLVQAGKFAQARKLADRLCRKQKNNPESWFLVGLVCNHQQNYVQAKDCYQRALTLLPDSIAIGVNLANVLKELGKVTEAEACYKKLLASHPDNVDVLYNLGVLHQSAFQYSEAESVYRQVLVINSQHLSAYNNLGVVLLLQFKLEEAEDVFANIIRSQPAYLDARRNLANVYREQSNLEKAEQQLFEILKLDPSNVPAKQDLALVLLQQGKFKQGWEEYEWRMVEAKESNERWPFPIWDGGGAEALTVLVFPEQGIGDQIMFSSCIPDLQEQVAHVVLACEPRLVPLMQRSFPAVEVVGRNAEQGREWLKILPEIDVQIPIGSLPKLYRKQIEDFPLNDHYLRADEALLEKWRERYQSLEKGLKIGLSWRGGHISNTRFKRSIELPDWLNILQLANVQFVNLQYGDCKAELAHIKNEFGITIYDWDDSDPLTDVDDFAAKIKALDLVISIDNSTIHLSGSLGVPTWVLQPFSADWRWLLGSPGSHWYLSVKQYQQVGTGVWQPVLDQIVCDLEAYKNNNLE